MSGPLTIQCTQFNVNVNNYFIVPPPPTTSGVAQGDQPVQDDVDPFDWNGLNFDNLSFDFDEDDATSTQFSADESSEAEDFGNSMETTFTGLEQMSTPFERRLVSETGNRGRHSVSRSATWSRTIISPTPAYGYVTPLGKFLQKWDVPSYAYPRYHPYGNSVSLESKPSRASSLPPLRRAVWRSASRLTNNSQWDAQTSSTPDVGSPWPQEKETIFPTVSNVYSEAFIADFVWPRIPPGAISTYSSLAGALGDSRTCSSSSLGSRSPSLSSSSSDLDSWDESDDSSHASTPAN